MADELDFSFFPESLEIKSYLFMPKQCNFTLMNKSPFPLKIISITPNNEQIIIANEKKASVEIEEGGKITLLLLINPN